MFKTVLTAAVAILATVPAMAQADPVVQFSHDGVNYTYTAKKQGEATIINGHASTGAPFRLIVRGERVSGTYNNRSVNFTRAQTDQADTLAAN